MNLDRLERLITKEEFARSVEIPNKKRHKKIYFTKWANRRLVSYKSNGLKYTSEKKYTASLAA